MSVEAACPAIKFRDSTDIDIVYTWVNWTAPEYIAQMKQHGILDSDETGMRYETAAGEDSYNELLYSLNSVAGNKLLDIIRTVWIVINPVHGPPAWLDLAHPKVKIVHHAEIMQSSGANKEIPTNNFWAIHTALHRIPGLAPWFLKIDDDTLLNRQVQVSDLFTNKGQARIRCPVGEVVWSHCPTLSII